MTWSNETYICTGTVGATATASIMITTVLIANTKGTGTSYVPHAPTTWEEVKGTKSGSKANERTNQGYKIKMR